MSVTALLLVVAIGLLALGIIQNGGIGAVKRWWRRRAFLVMLRWRRFKIKRTNPQATADEIAQWLREQTPHKKRQL